MISKTKEEIKQYWEDAALSVADGQGLRATARDPYLQTTVEDVMERHLFKSAALLDVGCGDGASTLRFAGRVDECLGVDYVDRYVQRARANADLVGCTNITFRQGDVTDLSGLRSETAGFDVVTSIRCLINLPSWELQAAGIGELAKCLRPGGRLLISEGWSEGWDGLNLLRQRCGLAPIAVVAYNRLISRRQFEAELSKYFDAVTYEGVGFYLMMSRVVQPYMRFPQPPEHTHEINRIGCELQQKVMITNQFDEIDYAGVYVCRKA